MTDKTEIDRVPYKTGYMECVDQLASERRRLSDAESEIERHERQFREAEAEWVERFETQLLEIVNLREENGGLIEITTKPGGLYEEIERLRAALRRAADAPCTHCSATDMHGERSTAHHWADQALRQT
jgi:non-homologous end joining protein Ku